MGMGTKVDAHEGAGTGTGIFYKRGYEERHCSTQPHWVSIAIPTICLLLTTCRNKQRTSRTIEMKQVIPIEAMYSMVSVNEICKRKNNCFYNFLFLYGSRLINQMCEIGAREGESERVAATKHLQWRHSILRY